MFVFAAYNMNSTFLIDWIGSMRGDEGYIWSDEIDGNEYCVWICRSDCYDNNVANKERKVIML